MLNIEKYKDEIKIKLELPGSTIKGTYEYFKNKDDNPPYIVVKLKNSKFDYLIYKK